MTELKETMIEEGDDDITRGDDDRGMGTMTELEGTILEEGEDDIARGNENRARGDDDRGGGR